jgi:hypothetical protein
MVKGNAFIQNKRVFVNVHREQARSHKRPSGSTMGLFLALSGFRDYAGLGVCFLHA